MELDDLKTAWKQIPEEKYDQNKIFKMLKQKSSNIIQWFFKFTLVELVLILLFTILPLLKGQIFNEDEFATQHSSIFSFYTLGSIITLITTLLFLGYSYKTYKKINVNESIKGLIEQIISYRKVVNVFIFFTVIVLIVISTPYYYNLGKSIYLNQMNTEINSDNANLYGYIAVTVAIVFILIITTIYYSFIYWVFLRKLTKNIHDLKEITE